MKKSVFTENKKTRKKSGHLMRRSPASICFQFMAASHGGCILYMYIAGSHNMPTIAANLRNFAFYEAVRYIPIAHVKKCNFRRFMSFLGLYPAFMRSKFKKYAYCGIWAAPDYISRKEKTGIL